ncbi:MAG: DUF3631 domain-containing protein [Candidatus Eisenbacteria bacterium]
MPLLDTSTYRPPRWLPGGHLLTIYPTLFRTVDKWAVTLLIDELDSFLRKDDDLVNILNTGYRRGAYVLRIVGDDQEPRQFSVFGAKSIAKIGRLPGTVEDRSIVLPLSRKLPGKEKVAPLRGHLIAGECEEPRRKCARWAQDNLEGLKLCDPEMLLDLNDRAADNWRALLAIADQIGGSVPALARKIALQYSGNGTEEPTSSSVDLLADTRIVFGHLGSDRISSKELVASLRALEDRPWADWNHGRGISPGKVAAMLKAFGIRPGSVRFGQETLKGYLLEQFEDAWARYLPEDPEHPEQASNGAVADAFLEPERRGPVPGGESNRNPHQSRSVPDVPAPDGDADDLGLDGSTPPDGEDQE